jgi:hypothetical protein
MSCPRRKPQGSGYCKPMDPVAAAANEKALAELMAARAKQDALLYGAWTADCSDSTPPLSPGPPASSTPGADVVQVDGHYYRFDNPGNAERLESDLEKLMAARGYQPAGAATSLFLTAEAANKEDGDRITHVGSRGWK